MRTTEQRAKGKGQRATYPTKIAIFLITLSGLILEVGLTRIYSASIWYHFAFVAISVALLGWGLGGFTVHLLKQRVRLSMDTAALVTLLYAGAIPLCLWRAWRCRLCLIFKGRWRGHCISPTSWGRRSERFW